MKKIFLITLLCLFLLVNVAYSAFIDVNVIENLTGNISSLNYDNSSNVVKLSIEFYNTGSVPYKNRIRIDVFNENEDIIFTGWSKEKPMMPGDRKVFEVYWYGEQGKYSTKIITYMGREIQEYKKFDILLTGEDAPEDVFEIKNFRTYDDYVIFDIQTEKDAQDIVIIPSQYTYGWVFEGETIESLPKNRAKTVVMKYEPSVWAETNVNLAIVSNEGMYYSEETLEMKKTVGLAGFFYYLIDSLRMTFA